MATSTLEQVLAEVQTLLLTRLAGVSFPGIGAQLVVDQSSAPPRVVWVRGVDRFDPADRAGGNPRSLMTKQTAMLAHCWAVGAGGDSDDKAIEDLENAVVWALRRVLGTSVLASTVEHLRDSPSAAGRACVVFFSIAQPITDFTAPTTTVAAVAPDASDAAPGDGALDCGSSD